MFSPDNVVIYCSSVWGGYSWALTDSADLAAMRRMCIQIEEEMGATLVCCTLKGLISAKSGDLENNRHWRVFVESVVHEEYEQFEIERASKLVPEALIDVKNREFLFGLLQVFFDTGYVTDYDRYLGARGVSVVH
jgi:hypothetical protein